MQWTLRRLLGVITAIAFAIAGTRTFGIAATISSLMILAAAWGTYSQLSAWRRTKTMLIAVACVTTVALYFGTFIAFRIFRTFEFSLAPDDDPNHNIVVFSSIPAAQEFARNLYYPLTKIVPGHCVYPTGDQMEKVNRNPFTDERNDLYW